MAVDGNFYFLISTLYCQMPANTRIDLIDKKTPQNKIEQVFLGRSTAVQDCKNGSGLQ